jgi:hypothetical protein
VSATVIPFPTPPPPPRRCWHLVATEYGVIIQLLGWRGDVVAEWHVARGDVDGLRDELEACVQMSEWLAGGVR